MNTLPYALLLSIFTCISAPYLSNAQEEKLYNEIGRLPVRYIDPSEYDANSSNWAITQDKDGVLYIGNSDGLLIYDGVTWELVRVPDGVIIRSLATSPDNIILIGSFGELGYLGTDSLGMPAYVSLKDQIREDHLQFNDVWNTVVDQQSAYFLSEDYLFRWKNNSMKSWASRELWRGVALVGDQLVVQDSGSLYYIDHQDSLRELSLDGTAFTDVRELVPHDSDRLYMLTGTGLIRCDIHVESVSTCLPLKTDIDDKIREGQAYTLLLLPDGGLAIGFDGLGVALLNEEGRLLHFVDDRDGLSNLEVMKLFLDQEGALWVALFDGLARIEPNLDLSVFSRVDGIMSSISDTKRWKGKLIVTTMLGVYELVPGHGYERARFEKLAAHRNLRGCFNLSVFQSMLWASCEGGLIQIIVDPEQPARLDPIIDEGFFTSAIADPNSPSTFYTSGSGITQYQYTQGRSEQIHHEAVAPYIFEILVEPKRNGRSFTRIWTVSHPYILQRVDVPFDGGPWETTTIGVHHGLEGRITRAKFLNGTLAVSTGTGLYTLVDTPNDEPLFKWLPYGAHKETYFIGADHEKHEWLVVQDSLYILNYTNNELSPISSTEHPFRLSSFPHVAHFYTEPEGTMWIGHDRGIVRYAGNESFDHPAPAIKLRRAFTLDTDSLIYHSFTQDQQGIEIPFEKASLRFEYAAQIYDFPENVLYRVWLEGLEGTWRPWTSAHSRDVTNLHEGSYTFHVQAKNIAGQSSEVASFSFEVLPPWYRSGWAYALWFLSGSGLLGSVAYGYSHFYSRRLTLHTRTLERLVTERTEEIQEKNATLERAFAELKETNNNLTRSNHALEERTAQLREALESNEEILGVTAHDLQNPLGGIIGLAELVILDTKENPSAAHASVLESLPLLKHEAEQMFQIVNGLLEKHRKGEDIVIKREPVELDNLVSDVMHWNSQQARRKNMMMHYCSQISLVLQVDPVAIQRVLDNFISNAIKYSPEGSDIKICIAPYESSTSKEKGVKVSVRDQGPGLTEEDKKRVFGKMQRLSAQPTGGEHSSGLGLFIAKSLIEAHDGEVGVDSVAGHGATFWFTLPCTQQCSDQTA